MYTSYIGKKFLKLYNEREGKSLTAAEFFDEVFFELFFTDGSQLIHVSNSPFFQKPKEEDVKKYGSKSLAQYNSLRKKLSSGVASGAVFVGYAAEEIQATTSGQLSSIDFRIDAEEMYASWIGEALGIGVSGGFVMLMNESAVLWALYQGWQYYRQFLQQTPNLKDKQIETWNGHWLAHSFGKNFNAEDPCEMFRVETSEVMGNIAIPTTAWSKVVFALSQKYPNQILTAYAYNLSQTNTTLGFINLYLPEVRKIYEFRDAIFLSEKDTILRDKQIEELQTFFNFKGACKLGTIGLKALEPDKLRTYMPQGSVPFAQGKDYKFSDQTSYFDYQLYKLWIIAMLNKTELLNLASEVARALSDFENKDKDNNRGKTNFSQEAKKVREAKNIREFIDELTEILAKTPVNAETFRQVVEQVIKMPADNFPLFATLIRFEYQYQKSKNAISNN
ncbi:MAG: hypothetical protein V4714_18275 [Bacteroidota bacterium]